MSDGEILACKGCRHSQALRGAKLSDLVSDPELRERAIADEAICGHAESEFLGPSRFHLGLRRERLWTSCKVMRAPGGACGPTAAYFEEAVDEAA